MKYDPEEAFLDEQWVGVGQSNAEFRCRTCIHYFGFTNEGYCLIEDNVVFVMGTVGCNFWCQRDSLNIAHRIVPENEEGSNNDAK